MYPVPAPLDSKSLTITRLPLLAALNSSSSLVALILPISTNDDENKWEIVHASFCWNCMNFFFALKSLKLAPKKHHTKHNRFHAGFFFWRCWVHHLNYCHSSLPMLSLICHLHAMKVAEAISFMWFMCINCIWCVYYIWWVWVKQI